MKKFTFLLVFVLSSMIVMSQNLVPQVEKLWDHSIAGTADWTTGVPIGGEAPEWMGNLTERTLDAYDGKVYTLSRKNNPPEFLIFDGETGNLVETVKIDTTVVKEGTYIANCLSITKSGKIVFANLATNTKSHPFKVYMAEKGEDGSYSFKELVSWKSPEDGAAYRLGGGLSVYGDISSEEDGYIITGNAHSSQTEAIIMKWDIVAGVVEKEPKMITLKEVYPAPAETKPAILGLTPKVCAVGPEHFWADGHGTFPSLYNMDGDLITAFKEATKPLQQGISGVKGFSFKNKDFLLLPTTNWTKDPKTAFQLFMIPEAGLEQADSIAILPEKGLGGQKNASFSAPVAVEVMEDHVNMYMMAPKNGLACYKLTLKDVTSSELLSNEEIQMYPNPTSGKVEFNRMLARVSVYSISGQLIFERSNVQKIDIQSPSGNYIINGVDLKGNSLKKILIVQ